MQEIVLHQQIDKFTDQHPLFIQSKNRISSQRKRFSGIMLDVFYDHFLDLNWERFSSIGFTTQIHDWYQKLNSDSKINLPSRMKTTLYIMREKELFSLYKTQSGISNTIDSTSQRIRFNNTLAGGGLELQ